MSAVARAWSWLGILAASVLALWGVPVAASAQTIESARTAYFEADFRRAESELEAVLARADLTGPDAVEAHRFLAALRATRSEADRARAHALAAAALDPNVSPPEGAPLEVAAMIEDARQALGNRAATLALEPVGALVTGAEARFRLRLEPAAPGLAVALGVTLSLSCRSGTAPAVEREGTEPDVSLELSGESPVSVSCHGAAITPTRARLLSIDRQYAVDETSASSGAGFPWGWVALGAGALVAIVTVIIVVAATSGSDQARVNDVRVEWP